MLGHTLIIADIERRHAATLGESAYAQVRRALMTITDPGGGLITDR